MMWGTIGLSEHCLERISAGVFRTDFFFDVTAKAEKSLHFTFKYLVAFILRIGTDAGQIIGRAPKRGEYFDKYKNRTPINMNIRRLLQQPMVGQSPAQRYVFILYMFRQAFILLDPSINNTAKVAALPLAPLDIAKPILYVSILTEGYLRLHAGPCQHARENRSGSTKKPRHKFGITSQVATNPSGSRDIYALVSVSHNWPDNHHRAEQESGDQNCSSAHALKLTLNLHIVDGGVT